MKLTQRTLILGAVVTALVVVLALQVVDAVFVVVALAMLALVGLVAWGRVRSQARYDEEADWASGGEEWGLATEDEGDEEYVDLDDRLSGFEVRRDIPRRSPAGADTAEFEVDEEAWEEVEDWEDAPGAASYDTDTVDEEFEEIVEAFDEPVGYLDEEVEEEYEEYVDDDSDEARHAASIFAAPGVIDEEAIDSDDAILAASEATRLQYDDVLTREDANAETREILSRVASLLAKYE